MLSSASARSLGCLQPSHLSLPLKLSHQHAPSAVCCHNSHSEAALWSLAPARRLPACDLLLTSSQVTIAVVRVVSCRLQQRLARCAASAADVHPLQHSARLLSALCTLSGSGCAKLAWLTGKPSVVVCCALYIAHAPWEIYMLTGSCQRRLLMYGGFTGIHWLSAVSVSLWPCVTPSRLRPASVFCSLRGGWSTSPSCSLSLQAFLDNMKARNEADLLQAPI